MRRRLRAAAAGKRVGLVDDNPAPGGQIWRSGSAQPAAARNWLAKLELATSSRLQGWRVFDSPMRGMLRAERNGACRDLRLWKTDSGHWRAGTLPAVSRVDAAQRDGSGRPGRNGAGRTADRRKARSGGRNRSAAAGGGGASGTPWRERRGALRAGCGGQLVSLAVRLLREPAKLLQGVAYGIATRGTRFYARLLADCSTG